MNWLIGLTYLLSATAGLFITYILSTHLRMITEYSFHYKLYHYLFLAVFVFCAFVSAFGISRFVNRRRRRVFWLIAIILVALPVVVDLNDNLWNSWLVLVWLICNLVWLVIFVLVCLKSKDKLRPIKSDHIPQSNAPKGIVAITVIVVVLTIGLIMKFSYTGYENPYQEFSFDSYFTDYKCSFEHPSSFYYPYEGTYEVWDDTTSLCKDRKTWFQPQIDSRIQIFIQSDKDVGTVRLKEETLENKTETEKALLFFDLATSGSNKIPAYIQNVQRTNIVVDGNPANYLTFAISENKPSHMREGTVRYVHLEHDGSVFLIILFRYERVELEPDPTFDHLIETFKISP